MMEKKNIPNIETNSTHEKEKYIIPTSNSDIFTSEQSILDNFFFVFIIIFHIYIIITI